MTNKLNGQRRKVDGRMSFSRYSKPTETQPNYVRIRGKELKELQRQMGVELANIDDYDVIEVRS